MPEAVNMLVGLSFVAVWVIVGSLLVREHAARPDERT
jgi:hypothetical protein